MTGKRRKHRPFIALLLAFALTTAVVPPQAGAVDRPAVAKLENGHLLIGTFLIHKDALTKPVLDAAKASMEESGQGMFYKSELADGAWCNIKNGTDIKAILKGEGVLVPDAEVDKLKVNVWVAMKDGKQTFTPLLTAAELDDKIAKLNDQRGSVEEENKQALKAQDDQAATTTAMKIATLQAQIDFWEALKSGDSAQAGEGLDKQSNPVDGLPSTAEQVLAATKQEGDKALAALEEAVNRASTQEVTTQLAELAEADAKLDGTRTSLLTEKQAALTSEQDKLAASLQDKQDRKQDIQTQNVALQELLNKANQQGAKEIAAALSAKISENEGKLATLRDVEKQGRIALLNQQKSALAPNQFAELVHIDALLKSEELGIASKIAELQEAKTKLTLEGAPASELAAVEQNLAKAQQEELVVEKQAIEAKQATLQKADPALDKRYSEVVLQILALDQPIAQTQKEIEQALAALDSAVKLSNVAEATAQLAKLNEADAKLQAARTALQQKTLAGLSTEKAKVEATLQDAGGRKRDIIKQNVALQAVLKQANKLGEKEIAAEVLLKVGENAAQLPALRETEQQNRVALLNLQKKELAGQPVLLVHVEALLRSEEQGIAQKISDLQDAQYKLTLEIAQEMAPDLAEDLRAVEQNLMKTQQEELILEKQLTEAKPANPELAQHHKDVILQILALEKKKYTAAELAALDAVGKGIKAAVGKSGQVLPVENVFSKDVEIKFQVPTVVIDGRAFIHIRPISEAFGSTVIWSDADQSVTINRGDTLVHCRIGDEAAYINGRKVKLDTAPRLIAQRTFVPLRFVMDALGLDVQWDNPTQSIEIKGIVN